MEGDEMSKAERALQHEMEEHARRLFAVEYTAGLVVEAELALSRAKFAHRRALRDLEPDHT
jgi:hypothetical protein